MPGQQLAWQACQSLTTAELGRVGERVAMAMLERHRAAVVARNLRVGRGEVDIVARLGRRRILVEVRSIRDGGAVGRLDPLDSFDRAKARQVTALAATLRCDRIDLIAVSFNSEGIDLRWVPDCT